MIKKILYFPKIHPKKTKHKKNLIYFRIKIMEKYGVAFGAKSILFSAIETISLAFGILLGMPMA